MMLAYLAIAFLVLATVYSAIVSFRQAEVQRASWLFPSGAKRWARITVSVITLGIVVAVAAAAWFASGSRTSSPHPLRFVIPENYSGWVRVDFGVKGAPALPVEAGKNLLKIPPGGRLQTSTAQQYGLSKDEYLFQSADGTRPIPYSGAGRMIWGRISGEATGAAGKQTHEEFFVGSEQQYRDELQGQKKAP